LPAETTLADFVACAGVIAGVHSVFHGRIGLADGEGVLADMVGRHLTHDKLIDEGKRTD
jgi:hypothetical protein